MAVGDIVLYFILITMVILYFVLYKKKFYKKLCKYKSNNMSKPKRLSIISSAEWHYRGEGNEYLAISLPEKRQILRLKKSLCPVGLTTNIKDWINENYKIDVAAETEAAIFLKLNLEYYKVLISLLGECYVQPAEEVLVVREEVQEINRIIFPLRPENRKKKCIAFACGSLLSDYAYLPKDWNSAAFDGPTIAIEIKPKQGWIPEGERIYPLCTFCHNQFIKLENNETSELSEYCPMDLFSGIESRMKYAVKCLLNTPQNNFKIFEEGKLVYDDSTKQKSIDVLNRLFKTSRNNLTINLVDELSDIITQALLEELHTDTNYKCCHTNNIVENFNLQSTVKTPYKICNFSRNLLPLGCVLDRILQLQELDAWGAEVVLSKFKNISPSKNPNCNYAHAKNIINRIKYTREPVSCAKCLFNEKSNKLPIESDIDNKFDLMLERYLLSAVTKDCSLMLTFRKLQHSSNSQIPKQNILVTDNEIYAFIIGVFDLYPKPLSCIQKHSRKRWKFTETYSKILNGEYSYTKCNRTNSFLENVVL